MDIMNSEPIENPMRVFPIIFLNLLIFVGISVFIYTYVIDAIPKVYTMENDNIQYPYYEEVVFDFEERTDVRVKFENTCSVEVEMLLIC